MGLHYECSGTSTQDDESGKLLRLCDMAQVLGFKNLKWKV